MAAKRPRMELRKEVARASDRHAVVIAGSCQVGTAEPQDVTVTDLAADGCRLRGIWAGMTKAEPVQLWLGGHGPVVARLKWARKGALGLAFEPPLDEAVVARLCEASAGATVVPLRRSRP